MLRKHLAPEIYRTC